MYASCVCEAIRPGSPTMEGSRELKHYHDEKHCCKGLMETYFSQPDCDHTEECLGFPLRKLHEFFSKGTFRPKAVLDISFGALVSHLFVTSSFCKEIYVLQLTKNSLDQFNQWMEKGDKATDWSHAAKRACSLEGNRQRWEEKEEDTKKAIKVVQLWENYEITKMDPLLVPEVDCVLSFWVLFGICKTEEELQRNLKMFTSRLKRGGYFILMLALNISFYNVGDHRFFALSMSEIEVQQALIKAGFVIEKSDVITATHPGDKVNYSAQNFIVLRKEFDD